MSDSKYIVVLGRVFYALIFLTAALDHFSGVTVNYAANQGVPLARWLVPLAGVLSFIGGLSILLGYKAKVGAWILVLFLVPVTFAMHGFWKLDDPVEYQIQMIMFMKNLSLIGVSLLITYFGSGPLSLDSPRPKTQS